MFDDSSPFDEEHPFDDGMPEEVDLNEEQVQQLCHEALSVLDTGDTDGARNLAAAAVDVDMDHPFPVFVLGMVADAEGDMLAAGYLSEQALQRAGTNADVIQFRAQVLLRSGEAEAAEQLLRYAIALHPEDAHLHEQLARTLLGAGEYDAARDAAQACLRLDPSDPSARAVLTASIDATGNTELLLGALRETVQLNPDDVLALLELAAVETEVGNTGRAALLLARARRLAPDEQIVREAGAILKRGNDTWYLRPLPSMMRWVREFPGGFPGFIAALVVMAVPMLAAATVNTAFAVAMYTMLGAWLLLAAYMLVAPGLAERRLNRRAAAGAEASIDGLPDLVDAVVLNVGAQRPGRAVALVERYGSVLGVGHGTGMTAAVPKLRRMLMSPGLALARIPAARQVLLLITGVSTLVAVAVATLMPVVAAAAGVIAITAACGAWRVGRAERRLLQRIEVAITPLDIGSSDLSASRGQRGARATRA